MPMPSPAKLIFILLMYTAMPTSTTIATENNKNSNHAVFGHCAQPPFRRYDPGLHNAHSGPV